MRILGVFTLFICSLVINFLVPASALAGSLSASGRITITARVAPTIYVIVNNQDQIMEVTSNTPEIIAPTIFRLKVAEGSQITATPEILDQYQALIKSKQGQMGTLYKTYIPTVEKPNADWPFRPFDVNSLSLLAYWH